jgi:hypothetical protein
MHNTVQSAIRLEIPQAAAKTVFLLSFQTPKLDLPNCEELKFLLWIAIISNLLINPLFALYKVDPRPKEYVFYIQHG